MYYIVGKEFITKAEQAKDHKTHIYTNYYGGTDVFGCFGVESWGDKKYAYRFIRKESAEAFARDCRGTVEEVDDV